MLSGAASLHENLAESEEMLSVLHSALVNLMGQVRRFDHEATKNYSRGIVTSRFGGDSIGTKRITQPARRLLLVELEFPARL
jgi:hypothetical protein